MFQTFQQRHPTPSNNHTSTMASVEVEMQDAKPQPLTCDLGHLLCNDPNPLPSLQSASSAAEREAILASTARDCAQTLINQLLTNCPITRAEGERQAAILAAEGNKQQQILQAQGQAEATRAIADAERYRKEAVAAGEANAVKAVYEAIHEGNPTPDLVTIKYLETLQAMADGKATKIIVPAEMSGLAGSLAGIGALLSGDTTQQQP